MLSSSGCLDNKKNVLNTTGTVRDGTLQIHGNNFTAEEAGRDSGNRKTLKIFTLSKGVPFEDRILLHV